MKPLPHELETAACAILLSVCAINGATHVLSVFNVSDKPVDLRAATQIAAISPVTPHKTASSISTEIKHLLRDKKIRKVLADHHFDAIKLDSSTKMKSNEMIDDFIDVFAECDSDVGSTNVVFHEIDTGGSQPLRQPARRISYGEQKNAVKSEIETLF